MSPFQQQWLDHAARYGLNVVVPFSLTMDGKTFTIPVLLRQFGHRNGMMLVTDSALIAPYMDLLWDRGFGFSCLSEPSAPREGGEVEAEEAFLDMLRDWGWSGDGTPPPWLGEAGET